MINTKILVVEDEGIVAMDIKNALLHLGFKVVNIAKDYTSAIKSVKQNEPTIILMDINLKNSAKDGIDTAIDIQKIKNIPIIYLTAFSDEETVMRAIHTNPISYLVKPFKREELKSTILLTLYKLNQHNKPQIDNNCVTLGYGYYYNKKEEILYFENMYIKLSINEKKLLNLLIEAKGAIVSYESLEHNIWTESPTSVSTLRTLIYRLRSKLEYKLIETIHAAGCRLTPEF